MASLSRKFKSCVKRVRRTVKAKNREGAAIAICTKTILHPRGKTIKRFSRKGLITQKLK